MKCATVYVCNFPNYNIKVKVFVTSRIELNEVSLQWGQFQEVRLLPLCQEDAIKLLRISSRPVSVTFNALLE